VLEVHVVGVNLRQKRALIPTLTYTHVQQNIPFKSYDLEDDVGLHGLRGELGEIAESVLHTHSICGSVPNSLEHHGELNHVPI